MKFLHEVLQLAKSAMLYAVIYVHLSIFIDELRANSVFFQCEKAAGMRLHVERVERV